MDRETIEEKDQRVTGKIREILQNKERSTGKKWHVWPLHKFTLPVLCAGVMLVGLMMLNEQPALTLSNNSEPTAGDVFENRDASGLEKSTDQIGATDAKNIAPAAVTPENAGFLSSRETEPPGIEALSPEAAPTSPEAFSSTDPSSKKTAAGPSTLPEQNRATSGIQISKIVSCSGVRKLQYVSPKRIFSLKKESTPTVWMTVVSDKPPFTLAHVYYVNGRRYCKVNLEIRYRRMRTWSNVTLKSLSYCGKWRVDVITDSGEKLDQIEFTVVP